MEVSLKWEALPLGAFAIDAYDFELNALLPHYGFEFDATAGKMKPSGEGSWPRQLHVDLAETRPPPMTNNWCPALRV